MLDLTTSQGRIVSAALRLAGERPWRDVTLTDIAALASGSDIVDGAIKLSIGKKRHALAKPV